MVQKKGSVGSATLWGVEAEPVHVEVQVGTAATQFEILGHPHAPAVRESRERIRAALRTYGVDLTSLSVRVNLAPIDLPKELPALDLPIALALLAALGHLPQSALDGRLVCGELGLDGSIRAIRGGLAFAEHAVYVGSRELLLPAATAAEASPLRALVGDFPLAPLATLTQTVQHLIVGEPFAWPAAAVAEDFDLGPELSEICGQEVPKRALEIAAAGGHNLLFEGPRETSPVRLARRLPALLPQLTPLEAMEVTMIASLFSDSAVPDLLYERPFRSPHATASLQGVVGGIRSIPRPGEATFAHQGVLYLEDLPEFRRETLMALRKPLREGTVTVCLPHLSRRAHMPARFILVASTTSCPCGNLGNPRHVCNCPESLVDRYRLRLNDDFLLDCFDLHCEVLPASLQDLQRRGETTATVARRVGAARAFQETRYSPSNALMSDEQVSRFCALDSAGSSLLAAATEKLGLSPATTGRILRVARSIADLEGAEALRTVHLAEALQFRPLRHPRQV